MRSLLYAAAKTKEKYDLEPAEMEAAMEGIVSGKAEDSEIEAFLLNLREKGETYIEVAAAVRVMRRHAIKLSKNYKGLLDTCGTGGDGHKTANVSTLSALTAAAAGARVAKHGNRSVSGVCGSADILELLGIRVDASVQTVQSCLEKTGFTFLFAPRFHPATRFAMPARKNIQGRTIFNLLGPLVNPANVEFQVIGVYSETMVSLVAKALLELGAKHAMVVFGRDGLDEISIADETLTAEIVDGRIRHHVVSPEDAGLDRWPLKELRCETKEQSLDVAEQTLRGRKGAVHDAVCLNTAAALMVAGHVKTLRDGVMVASAALESGDVYRKVREIATISQSLTLL